MKLFMVLFQLGIPSVAPEIHSLKFFHTSSSEVPNFPQYVAVYLVDDIQILHYDSNTRRAVPEEEWKNKITEEHRKFLEEETEKLRGREQTNKGNLEIAMQRFNQTGGVHINQRMSGCEWDDETGEVSGFNQYGYDGEDFITLDLKTETWIAARPQAFFFKHKWDNNKALMAHHKNYFTKECPVWLKKLLNFGRSSLMRKELPSVYLLQKTPSSPVTCLASGFYPDRADLFWKRDEEELHEEVVRGEILPNHDGTFQMSVDLDLSSVTAEDWRRYSCVFHLAGVKEEVLTPLDKHLVLTNWRGFPPAAAAAAAAAGLLLPAGCISGLVLWRRKGRGCRRSNTSEGSSSSGHPAVEERSSEEQTMLERAEKNQKRENQTKSSVPS